MNTTQQIRKSLGSRGRRLIFAVLSGSLPIGVTMGKILKTSAEDRKCMFPDCKCTLSIYNHGDYCHVHREQAAHEQKPDILVLPRA